MEKRGRRQFLREMAAGALGMYGVSKAKRAEAAPRTPETQEQDREVIKKITQTFENQFNALFFWINAREKGQSKEVHGRENVTTEIVSRIKAANAELLVFGEAHDNVEIGSLLLDVVEQDKDFKVIAQEAHDHTDGEYYTGLLTGASGWGEDFKQKVERSAQEGDDQFSIHAEVIDKQRRLRALQSERGLAVSLLHHPFTPNEELQTKVLGLRAPGEKAAILVGSHHAMLGYGETGDDRRDGDSSYHEYAQSQGTQSYAVAAVPISIQVDKAANPLSFEMLGLQEVVQEHLVEYIRTGGRNVHGVLSEVDKTRASLVQKIEQEGHIAEPFLVHLQGESDKAYLITDGAEVEVPHDMWKTSDLDFIYSHPDIQSIVAAASEYRISGKGAYFTIPPNASFSVSGQQITASHDKPMELVLTRWFEKEDELEVRVNTETEVEGDVVQVGLLELTAAKNDKGQLTMK